MWKSLVFQRSFSRSSGDGEDTAVPFPGLTLFLSGTSVEGSANDQKQHFRRRSGRSKGQNCNLRKNWTPRGNHPLKPLFGINPPIPQPTLAEISQMVDDENENIEEGLKMSIKARVLGKSPKKEKPHEDAPEDLQPEMLAAIMHTEEQGLAMAAPPTQLYNYLFPEGGADASIPVSSVIAAPLQDVVVPTSVPKELHITVNNEDLQQAQASTAEKVQASPRKPTDSMYAEANQGQVPQVPPTPAVPKGSLDEVAGILFANRVIFREKEVRVAHGRAGSVGRSRYRQK